MARDYKLPWSHDDDVFRYYHFVSGESWVTASGTTVTIHLAGGNSDEVVLLKLAESLGYRVSFYVRPEAPGWMGQLVTETSAVHGTGDTKADALLDALRATLEPGSEEES